jgi:predicted DNA-binding ribbon-helix-helix protein
LVYDRKDKTFYVFDKKTNEKFNTFASWIKFLKNKKKIFGGERSALATIFFEPNSSSFNLASILRTQQIPYWKSNNSTNIIEVTSLVRTYIDSIKEFSSVGIREIVNGIGITFFKKEQILEKNLIFKWHGNLISYELYVLEKSISEINGIATGIAIERTLFELDNIINYVSKAKICSGQKTKGILINKIKI